jgi:hypothetical protein
MSANDGQQAIALKERAGRLVGEKVRAAAHVIVYEALRSFLLPKVLHGVRPEDITHKTGCRWLAEAIQLKGRTRKVWPMIRGTMGTTYVPNVIQGVQLGRKSSMDAEKLLIHDGGKGKCTERVHAGVVQALGVLTLTCRQERSEGPK